jgi:transcriptional regulator with XRE-family HTH domain
LRVIAELAGITESSLCRLELGQRPLDSRSKPAALAAALQVAPPEITGQPYPPSTENDVVAHAAAQTLRAVLGDIEVGEPLTEVPPQSLAELRGEVAAVDAACAPATTASLGRRCPT